MKLCSSSTSSFLGDSTKIGFPNLKLSLIVRLATLFAAASVAKSDESTCLTEGDESTCLTEGDSPIKPQLPSWVGILMIIGMIPVVYTLLLPLHSPEEPGGRRFDNGLPVAIPVGISEDTANFVKAKSRIFHSDSDSD